MMGRTPKNAVDEYLEFSKKQCNEMGIENDDEGIRDKLIQSEGG